MSATATSLDRRASAGRIAACVLLVLAACTNLKVKLPASDSTPPMLVWNVYSHDTSQQNDHPGSPTLTAKRGQTFRITLKASDPQGVKSIELNPTLGGGELAWQCTSGGLGQNKTATLAPMVQNLSPDSNGMVLTSIFLIQSLDFTMECQAGWTFKGGSGQLTGRASNYFGGVTTETIKFTVTP